MNLRSDSRSSSPSTDERCFLSLLDLGDLTRTGQVDQESG
jgi:hypothetical protein